MQDPLDWIMESIDSAGQKSPLKSMPSNTKSPAQARCSTSNHNAPRTVTRSIPAPSAAMLNPKLGALSDDERTTYSNNMRRLILTARSQINELTSKVKKLEAKSEASGVVQCPSCTNCFRAKQHVLMPKYIKTLRGKMTVEIEFNNLDELNEWVILNQLDTDSQGLPTIIPKEEKINLSTTRSLIPELVKQLPVASRHEEASREKVRISIAKPASSVAVHGSVKCEPAETDVWTPVVSNRRVDQQNTSSSSSPEVGQRPRSERIVSPPVIRAAAPELNSSQVKEIKSEEHIRTKTETSSSVAPAAVISRIPKIPKKSTQSHADLPESKRHSSPVKTKREAPHSAKPTTSPIGTKPSSPPVVDRDDDVPVTASKHRISRVAAQPTSAASRTSDFNSSEGTGNVFADESNTVERPADIRTSRGHRDDRQRERTDDSNRIPIRRQAASARPIRQPEDARTDRSRNLSPVYQHRPHSPMERNARTARPSVNSPDRERRHPEVRACEPDRDVRRIDRRREHFADDRFKRSSPATGRGRCDVTGRGPERTRDRQRVIDSYSRRDDRTRSRERMAAGGRDRRDCDQRHNGPIRAAEPMEVRSISSRLSMPHDRQCGPQSRNAREVVDRRQLRDQSRDADKDGIDRNGYYAYMFDEPRHRNPERRRDVSIKRNNDSEARLSDGCASPKRVKRSHSPAYHLKTSSIERHERRELNSSRVTTKVSVTASPSVDREQRSSRNSNVSSGERSSMTKSVTDLDNDDDMEDYEDEPWKGLLSPETESLPVEPTEPTGEALNSVGRTAEAEGNGCLSPTKESSESNIEVESDIEEGEVSSDSDDHPQKTSEPSSLTENVAPNPSTPPPLHSNEPPIPVSNCLPAVFPSPCGSLVSLSLAIEAEEVQENTVESQQSDGNDGCQPPSPVHDSQSNRGEESCSENEEDDRKDVVDREEYDEELDYEESMQGEDDTSSHGSDGDMSDVDELEDLVEEDDWVDDRLLPVVPSDPTEQSSKQNVEEGELSDSGSSMMFGVAVENDEDVLSESFQGDSMDDQ